MNTQEIIFRFDQSCLLVHRRVCTNIVTIMINTRISKETVVVKQLINHRDKYKKRLNQSL